MKEAMRWIVGTEYRAESEILSIEKYRNVNYSLIYLLIEIGQILEKWK